MSCGDLSGAELNPSVQMSAKQGDTISVDGKIEANAPSCVHEIVWAFTRPNGTSFSLLPDAPVTPGVWYPKSISVSAGTFPVTGVYTLVLQGNHYAGAGGYPNGPITFSQVESDPLKITVYREEIAPDATWTEQQKGADSFPEQQKAADSWTEQQKSGDSWAEQQKSGDTWEEQP